MEADELDDSSFQPQAALIRLDDGIAHEDCPSGEGTASDSENEADNGNEDQSNNNESRVDDSDAGCCPICLEPWSSSGRHRLCSLRCGHLFGRLCIDRWLAGGKVKCPQCNAPAKRADIRVLYCKRLVALDTTERDCFEAALTVERTERRRLEESLGHANLNIQLLRAELETLKAEASRLRKRRFSEFDDRKDGFQMRRPLNFNRRVILGHGGSFQCRSLAFDAHYGIFLVSRSDVASKQFGVVKVSLWDSNGAEFVALHDDAIRAVASSPHGDGLFLTTGADNLLRLSTMNSNSVVQTWKLPSSAWSCAFHPRNSNLLLVGLTGGQVACYDARLPPHHPPITFNIMGSLRRPSLPIHSLLFEQNLVIGATMDGPFAFPFDQEGNVKSWWSFDFGHQGFSCSSLSLNNSVLLANFRSMPPGALQPSRHVLFELKEFGGEDGADVDPGIPRESQEAGDQEPREHEIQLKIPFLEFKSQGAHKMPFKASFYTEEARHQQSPHSRMFECFIPDESTHSAHCYQPQPDQRADALSPTEVLSTNAGIPVLESLVVRIKKTVQDDDQEERLGTTTVLALLTEKHLYLYTSN